MGFASVMDAKTTVRADIAEREGAKKETKQGRDDQAPKPSVSGVSAQAPARRAEKRRTKRSALAFQSVDDVERGDSLALRVLSVGDRVSDDVFEEDLEDASGLFEPMSSRSSRGTKGKKRTSS